MRHAISACRRSASSRATCSGCVPDTSVEVLERCTGHGRDLGLQAGVLRRIRSCGAAAAARARRAGAGLIVSDCPLAALQLEQQRGQRVYHPVEALDAAYEGTPLPALMPMDPIGLEELLGRERYGAERDAIRRRVIEHKRSRRVTVGDRICLLFEDRATVWYQTQEMIWVEHITDLDAIREELAVYGALLPRRSELSATLLIEITDQAHIREELARLLGIDRHVWLEVGSEQRVPAVFDEGRQTSERSCRPCSTCASRSMRKPRTDAVAGAPLTVAVDHPAYRASHGALRRRAPEPDRRPDGPGSRRGSAATGAGWLRARARDGAARRSSRSCSTPCRARARNTRRPSVSTSASGASCRRSASGRCTATSSGWCRRDGSARRSSAPARCTTIPTTDAHDHFVCRQCGRVEDLMDERCRAAHVRRRITPDTT